MVITNTLNVIIYVIFVILIKNEGCYTKKAPKIAVVGGGIGGTSASYFLHELFGANGAHIDVYEWNKIGGRLSTVEVNGRDYEVGGSIIHQRNKYMVDFLKLLGLNKRQSGNFRFGLYDGHEFVYTESNWDIINLAKLVWRYGYGPLKLQNHVEDTLQKFESIYALQANGKSFSSVSDLLMAMNPQFVQDLHVSTKDGFRKDGFSERIIDELVLGTLTANYGQSTGVHKFVGSVSVAGAGGGLWAVQGGNRVVPEMLLERSQATLITAKVTNITLRPETEDFVVHSVNGPDFNVINKNSSIYDIVIIAAPLTEDTNANIKFTNFAKQLTFPGDYHRTVCTLIRGEINETYFGFKNEKGIDDILTVKLGLLFSAIGRIYPVDYKLEDKISDVWKVFSQVPLTEVQLHNLFPKHKSVNVIDWAAYPNYHTNQRCDKFILHKNLFHVNAIEWAASAMEMSVIGAKNVALLSYKSWTGAKDTENIESVKEEL